MTKDEARERAIRHIGVVKERQQAVFSDEALQRTSDWSIKEELAVQIRDLQRAWWIIELAGGAAARKPPFATNDRVKVTGGWYEGHEGVVQDGGRNGWQWIALTEGGRWQCWDRELELID